MPTNLTKEQASIMLNMLDIAESYEIDDDNKEYHTIYDQDLRGTIKSDEGRAVRELLSSDEPKLEIDEPIEELFPPLEIAISTNNKEAFDTLIELGADVNISNSEAIKMLGIAIENYAISKKDKSKTTQDIKDATYITEELIKTSSQEVLLQPVQESHNLLKELSSLPFNVDEKIYKASLDRLEELPTKDKEEFITMLDLNGDSVMHNLMLDGNTGIADLIIDSLSPEATQQILTARNLDDSTPKDLAKDDRTSQWYDKKIQRANKQVDANQETKRREIEEKVKAARAKKAQEDKIKEQEAQKAEQELEAILKAEEEKKAKLEEKKASRSKKKKNKKKNTEQNESIEAEPNKARKDDQDKAKTIEAQKEQEEDKPLTSQKIAAAKKEKANKIASTNEGNKEELTTIEKPETNQELYQRFADSVSDSSKSLGQISKIQHEINQRDDRKGFDEFLSSTPEGHEKTVKQSLIDEINSNKQYQNDEGKLSAKSRKILKFVAPELKEELKQGQAAKEEVKSSESVATTSPSVDARSNESEQQSQETNEQNSQLEQSSSDSPAQGATVSYRRIVSSLTKQNRQLSRDNARLKSQIGRKNNVINDQGSIIRQLHQQVQALAMQNEQLTGHNQGLMADNAMLQTQMQQVQMQQTQGSFQDRVSPNGPFQPQDIIRQRQELEVATEALNQGKDFRAGEHFVAVDGELINLDVSEATRGK